MIILHQIKKRRNFLKSSQTYKPKLIVLTSRFPYPLEKGDKLRAYYQLEELNNNYDLHLIALTEIDIKKEWENEVAKFCKHIYIFKLSKIEKYFGTLLQVFTQKPFQVGYFTSQSKAKKINRLLGKIQPDHIYCQLIRPAEYVKDYHACSKTIDYMDALSKGIERRMEKASWFKKWFFKLEFDRLKNYEHKIFDYFEHHTIITAQDREMIFHKERARIKIIPNGVAPIFFNYSKKIEKKTDLLFTGNLSYPPNVEACKYLKEAIMPLLPEFKLQISGANPAAELRNIQNSNITVTGWIDDIRDAYANAQIFIAPMFIGTGLQNKLLEAMAMGIPCITTSLANNALGAVHNQSILIANTQEEFIDAIQRLKRDQELYNNIKLEARKFVNKNFNWHSSSVRLIELMKS